MEEASGEMRNLVLCTTNKIIAAWSSERNQPFEQTSYETHEEHL